MTTENTNELNDLESHIINITNQFIKWKKRTNVDAIINQIIKINDCVDINTEFLTARLNSRNCKEKISQYRIIFIKIKIHKHLI